ncbi:hypothetical protein BURPS305_1036 [Burkholderia pseudomallei 305]|nr:hypothetical protein BURPS305_1036 [Burkholderia pseudomallei 305]
MRLCAHVGGDASRSPWGRGERLVCRATPAVILSVRPPAFTNVVNRGVGANTTRS